MGTGNFQNRLDFRIGIVVARFNDLITSRLAQGARNTLLRKGIPPENIVEVEVPGSFEIPLTAQWLIDNHAVQGVVALGAVIRGSTSHYDYVCSGVTSGIMNVQLSRNTPIGFGVLTCENMEQALDRAGGKLGNKGAETAEALLEQVCFKHSLQ
jgi:6,7-dimethyl-8-ribityllumazine synthase